MKYLLMIMLASGVCFGADKPDSKKCQEEADKICGTNDGEGKARTKEQRVDQALCVIGAFVKCMGLDKEPK